MKRLVAAVFLTSFWISVSEFTRNELLFKHYWVEKYTSLGLVFPSEPLNNALWGLWSVILGCVTVLLTRKLSAPEVFLFVWVLAFLQMWIVVGNLNVLPLGLLLWAAPLSILEVVVAVMISVKIGGMSKGGKIA